MNLPVEVVEATREGRCVVFLGSRVTGEAAEAAGRTYPSNAELAKELGWRRPKRLAGTMPGSRRNQKTIVPSVAEGAARYADEHGRAALLARLRLQVGAQGVAPSRAHELALRRFPLVFTTTWDGLVDEAVRLHGTGHEVRQRGAPVPKEPDPAAPVVYRLRGSLDSPEGVVLTAEDYRARPWPEAVGKQLRQLIRKQVIFFVGYKPDEEEFEHLWADLSEAYGGELPRCHLAVAQGRVDDYLWQKWVWRGLLLFTADPTEALEALEAQL